MKENYLITIENTQTGEEGSERYTLSTVGDYRYDGKKRTIRYADSPATGFDGCETSLDIDGGSIVFRRTGKMPANLILEAGKRFMGHYGTPIGVLDLGVYTNSVDDRLTENGGSIDFSYTLDINANFFARNDLKITVREKKKNV